MNKKMFLIMLLLLQTTFAYAAQQPVTVGTEAEKADIDTNFANTHANFTELYAADITSGSCVSNVIVLTKADTSTITTTIPCDSDVNIAIVEDSLVVSYAGATDSIPLSSLGGGVTSYNDLTDKPTIPTVDDTAYNATDWDGNTDAPTKNTVRDKIEALSLAAGATIDDTGGDGDTTVVWSADKSQEVADSKQDAFPGTQTVTATGLAVVTAADAAAARTAIGAEAADATILKDADIGVTVQGTMDADDVTGLFSGTGDYLKVDGTTGTPTVGSFALDTFPVYEDSAHSSGFAVNGTQLAVYSGTAGEWGVIDLDFTTLSAMPTTYTLSATITDGDATGDSFTIRGTAYDVGDSPVSISGISDNSTITYSGSNTATATGTGVTEVTAGQEWSVSTSDSDESVALDISAAAASIATQACIKIRGTNDVSRSYKIGVYDDGTLVAQTTEQSITNETFSEICTDLTASLALDDSSYDIVLFTSDGNFIYATNNNGYSAYYTNTETYDTFPASLSDSGYVNGDIAISLKDVNSNTLLGVSDMSGYTTDSNTIGGNNLVWLAAGYSL